MLQLFLNMIVVFQVPKFGTKHNAMEEVFRHHHKANGSQNRGIVSTFNQVVWQWEQCKRIGGMESALDPYYLVKEEIEENVKSLLIFSFINGYMEL